MANRTSVTQEMCDHARLLLKGGATHYEAARILGISKATVSRIRSSGYCMQRFNENTEKRIRAEQQKKKMDEMMAGMKDDWDIYKDGLPGQVRMELPEKTKEIMAREAMKSGDHVLYPESNEEQKKLFMFLAGQFDDIDISICHKIDEIKDLLGQILRAMRKE